MRDQRKLITRQVTMPDGSVEIRQALVPGRPDKATGPARRVLEAVQAQAAGALGTLRNHGADKGPPPKPRRNIPPGARRQAGDRFTPHAKDQP